MINMSFSCIAIECEYIHNNEGYDKLIDSIASVCRDGDYIIISETPISTAEGNLVDESNIQPSTSGQILYYISRYLWGHILCPLLKDKKRTIRNLQKLPKEAIVHKEFILRKYGLRYGLMPTGEAGVDLSNVPDEYVSLLPDNPDSSANTIKKLLKDKYSKDVEVIIIDTDATYEIFNRKFTTLPKSIKDIKNNLGIYAYLLKFMSKELGPTILASTVNLDCDLLIRIASNCEKKQLNCSDEFFETVYDMRDNFNSNIKNVSSQMLSNTKHIPAVIYRKE